MTTDLEKQFFDTFGIEPIEQEVFVLKRMIVREYPQITDTVLLKLEEIFAHVLFDDSGFFDGFHIYKSKKGVWIYQLTHRIGGYYAVGRGDTRKDALLNQFIIILHDPKVDEDEKNYIKHQVRTLFEEG